MLNYIYLIFFSSRVLIASAKRATMALLDSANLLLMWKIIHHHPITMFVPFLNMSNHRNIHSDPPVKENSSMSIKIQGKELACIIFTKVLCKIMIVLL